MSRSYIKAILLSLVLLLVAALAVGCPPWTMSAPDDDDDSAAAKVCSDTDLDGWRVCVDDPVFDPNAWGPDCNPYLITDPIVVWDCVLVITGESAWSPWVLGYYAYGDADCDDTNPNIHRGVDEECDEVDNDCNPWVREDLDMDADGFTVCERDCQDDEIDVYPGAPDNPMTREDESCGWH